MEDRFQTSGCNGSQFYLCHCFKYGCSQLRLSCRDRRSYDRRYHGRNLGLLAKYWRKIITPVVAASVVTSIGFSLFTVGARSFGGGYNEDFGSAQNLLLGTITLAVCLLWNVLSKGYLKQLSVLAGLVVGYIIAIFMGKVDLGSILSGGLISLPHLLPVNRNFMQEPLFPPALSSWYLRRRPSAILPHLFLPDWTVRSLEKNFRFSCL